jgi:hypothetical protein
MSVKSIGQYDDDEHPFDVTYDISIENHLRSSLEFLEKYDVYTVINYLANKTS